MIEYYSTYNILQLFHPLLHITFTPNQSFVYTHMQICLPQFYINKPVNHGWCEGYNDKFESDTIVNNPTQLISLVGVYTKMTRVVSAGNMFSTSINPELIWFGPRLKLMYLECGLLHCLEPQTLIKAPILAAIVFTILLYH